MPYLRRGNWTIKILSKNWGQCCKGVFVWGCLTRRRQIFRSQDNLLLQHWPPVDIVTIICKLNVIFFDESKQKTNKQVKAKFVIVTDELIQRIGLPKLYNYNTLTTPPPSPHLPQLTRTQNTFQWIYNLNLYLSFCTHTTTLYGSRLLFYGISFWTNVYFAHKKHTQLM